MSIARRVQPEPFRYRFDGGWRSYYIRNGILVIACDLQRQHPPKQRQERRWIRLRLTREILRAADFLQGAEDHRPDAAGKLVRPAACPATAPFAWLYYKLLLQ